MSEWHDYEKAATKRIAELTQQLKDSEGRCKARDKVIASLEQESERLREALKRIKNDDWCSNISYEIARAALEESSDE